MQPEVQLAVQHVVDHAVGQVPTAVEYLRWIPAMPFAGALALMLVGRRLPRMLVGAVAAAPPDAFTPIARDGAGTVEVGVRLQKALASLAGLGSKPFEDNARRHSALALKRSSEALALDADKAVLKDLAQAVGRT